ncbi:MAG: hypothetical protein LBS43_03425 [Prevotellaceae bacterium]|nr:hypothetical protein [Prevotellaceae bacterium]
MGKTCPRSGKRSPKSGKGSPRLGKDSPKLGKGSPRSGKGSPRLKNKVILPFYEPYSHVVSGNVVGVKGSKKLMEDLPNKIKRWNLL